MSPCAISWTGWRRWAPLAVGAYVLAALMPVMIGSGGPPAPAALWTIAGWDALWSLVAVAALIRPSTVDAWPRTPVSSGVD
ncbi:hypothetical protein ACFPIJ_08325 [Dactylosporangium cerinum]|uniref:Uncharacterized protein n=1 Tax=Dactylosporangium cerinum TaxID=1434730 RepID=A0ABV9VPC0_9ACTN